jgi:hypothetical protein
VSLSADTLTRPFPPPRLFEEDLKGAFAPAPEVERWIRATFIDPASPLYDELHDPLEDARIGVLWTTAAHKRKGVAVAGTAEMPQGGTLFGWRKELYLWQMRRWFGGEEWDDERPLGLPDFLITLDANYADGCSDVNFCAVAKHELCHCRQATKDGAPWFREDGRRVWAIAPHDAETFVSVARDFGPVDRGVAELYEALKLPPRVAQADIDWVCGNGLRLAA